MEVHLAGIVSLSDAKAWLSEVVRSVRTRGEDAVVTLDGEPAVTSSLDASGFIAAISPSERHHRQARLLFGSHPDSAQFLLPEFFRVQVIAGLTRRGEPVELPDAVDALARGPRFCACRLDHDLLEEAVRVGCLERLRAYVAVYVALALGRSEPRFRLDEDVVSRCLASFPALRVVGVS